MRVMHPSHRQLKARTGRSLQALGLCPGQRDNGAAGISCTFTKRPIACAVASGTCGAATLARSDVIVPDTLMTRL
jgi:hypothetical protein